MSRYAHRGRFGLRRQRPMPATKNQFASTETKADVMSDINAMVETPRREIGQPAHKRIDVRYVVKYPMLGDLPGEDWLQIVGDSALKAGIIKGYRLLHVAQGAFGLQNVLFLMDANVIVGDYDHIANDGWRIASNIVGESDIQILGIELI